MTGAERIAAERQRQIEVEGWSPEHDAEHPFGDLTMAAVCYALHARYERQTDEIPSEGWWPWSRTVIAYDFMRQSLFDGWKPSPDPIRNLEKAGALIAAEIDRLVRETPEREECA